jgi:hypothetical protein
VTTYFVTVDADTEKPIRYARTSDLRLAFERGDKTAPEVDFRVVLVTQGTPVHQGIPVPRSYLATWGAR